nr:unnamed protein product [Callosobruchus analis]
MQVRLFPFSNILPNTLLTTALKLAASATKAARWKHLNGKTINKFAAQFPCQLMNPKRRSDTVSHGRKSTNGLEELRDFNMEDGERKGAFDTDFEGQYVCKMNNKRKRDQSGLSEEEVDENENRPEDKRNEMKFFKYSMNDLLKAIAA